VLPEADFCYFIFIEPLCVEASTLAEKFGGAVRVTPPLWVTIDTLHTGGAANIPARVQ